MSRGRVVGEYQVGRQVGSGSFSVVWHGRHRVHGTEVAIKEIATTRLNKKLWESLMSEIVILKNINHPNIIRLHDIIEVPGKIHLVLEYCKGGDLSMFIQRHGTVPEATAKHFMKQLASGLQVLRDNNLIHRDLKPQNLLLSTTENKSVLKIADFGFARSLQPRGLAETLCGSPLYMAPEIMQLQKYDAKADLWSVGAILFQLVVGKTPFTGNNQIQLLQNIIKATELHFPHDTINLTTECKDLCHKLLRRNPVERLTFEEFFNHPFLSSTFPDETLRTRRIQTVNESNIVMESNMPRSIEEGGHDDCLPFFLDDDSNYPDEIPYMGRKSSVRPSYGFSPDTKSRGETTSNISRKAVSSTYGVSLYKAEQSAFQIDKNRPPEENLKDSLGFIEQKPEVGRTRGIVDSLELEDQDYVFVSGPSMDVSSSVGTSKPTQSQCISESPPAGIKADVKSSYPMKIVGSTVCKGCTNSLESHASAPGTSQGSLGMRDALEHPSSNFMTRIKSLFQCASAIRDLIAEKIEMGKQLEAFSVQLVSLAIWKQALHICHTQAASAMELGSPAKGTINHMKNYYSNELECLDDTQSVEHIEREFLLEVERAEELSKVVESGDMEMPDAIETIYQSALALGRHGAVDELMGNAENAELLYSKSMELFRFLVVEAPSLILNPPFSLTHADRYRLRTYIDIVGGRRGQSRSQRMALLTSESQACLL